MRAHREISVAAEVWCIFVGESVGVSWDERHMPTAPAVALAEWLRRESCDICGRKGAGCVIVSYVELYEDPPDGGDCLTIEELRGPCCVDDLVPDSPPLNL